MATTTPRRLLRKLRWSTPLDNYEPPRDWAHGMAEVFEASEFAPETVVLDTTDLPLGFERANFLLDDGVTVTPWYVAGWREDRTVVFLNPFPTNPDGRVRADNNRLVDYSNWVLGPRKTYHLKVTVVAVEQ